MFLFWRNLVEWLEMKMLIEKIFWVEVSFIIWFYIFVLNDIFNQTRSEDRGVESADSSSKECAKTDVNLAATDTSTSLVNSHNISTEVCQAVKEVVNESGDDDEVVDSDGEVLGFENLVFAIFEFVHALVETSKFKGAVKAGLADLMYYIVLYMQITEEQCQKWSDNPDTFVQDED